MIAFTNVSMHHGQRALFVEASFQLNPGEKVGLVGPNGAGKSTLFRLLMGEEMADEGQINVPKRLRITYFRQEHTELEGRSVLDEAIVGSGRLGELHAELAELEQAMENPDHPDMDRVLTRFGEVQSEYQDMGGYELEARAMEILHGLGFSDAQIQGSTGELSGGWKMRVGMAKALLAKPDVLLLDEPTNHLDIESIMWLERYLRDTPAAILMTCHDRDFMNCVVSRILDIDGGELVSYTGDYQFYENAQQLRATQQAAAYERQQATLAKMQRFIDRFGTHAAKAAQAQSRAKKIEKIERLDPPRTREVVKFQFKEPPRSGNDVAILEGVKKAYGDQEIYSGFDLRVCRGERWCVMGQNGSGKTTLLKMVAGITESDAGTLRIGANVKLGYFAQEALEVLNSARTVWEETDQRFPTATIGSKRSLLGAFQFSGDDIEKSVSILSGGEKSRLVLALMLFDPPNFLVLDEPTNHLDLHTKQMLIETLKNFSGTMLFVSHDRTFLKGLANRVLDVSRERAARTPRVYEGSYVEWVEATGEEAPGVRHLG